MTLLPDPSTPLEYATAHEAFGAILDGGAADEAIAAFLVGLAERGETSVEIAAAARCLRERMIEVAAPRHAIDVCGTGGDASGSLNVSTAVAIVVAAAGVPVAKHGNRAATSRSAGAADTLEALGLDLARASARAEESLGELGLAFLFAQAHHPALVRLAPLRRAIGRRTLFNLTGPLANPARVARQLIGVARPELLRDFSGALELLGAEAALVVAGDEPLDELSVAGPSSFAAVGALPLGEGRLEPEEAGLSRYPAEALRGGSAVKNAAALRALLGGVPGAYRDAVLLNAGAALLVAGRARDWRDGAARAAEAVDDGAAADLLARWIALVDR